MVVLLAFLAFFVLLLLVVFIMSVLPALHNVVLDVGHGER
jgi:hypothetical protein